MDAANVDLKGFTDAFYRDVCAAHLEPVLETLEYVKHGTSAWLEITNLVIPGLNDSDAEFDAMTHWIVDHLGPDVPVHFTAFHPDWKMLDRPPTPAATLARACQIASRNGIRYAYTATHDARGEATRCHICEASLIERDGYELTGWRLSEDGRCEQCGTACAGVFEKEPGHWGSRRRPVRMSLAP
jgi:pyruvate formate lyase activating enzyme